MAILEGLKRWLWPDLSTPPESARELEAYRVRAEAASMLRGVLLEREVGDINSKIESVSRQLQQIVEVK